MSEFIKIGDNIQAKPKGCDYDLIPGKVYDLNWNRMMGEVIFRENGELNLPKKVYQTKKDELFKKRVLNYFETANSNTTGVMLAGTKGTGKSIEAKVIARDSGLPIIIVNPEFPESRLTYFFKQFTTPVCIIFDEVEKAFDTDRMLDFLDGIEKTAKKLVLMTCNNLGKISDYMQDRCSRIRYLRTYTAESNLEFLPMIVEDLNIKNKKQVIKFVKDNIMLPSMDNLYSFLNEVKLLEDEDISLTDIIDVMNISTKGKIIPESDDYDDYNEKAEEHLERKRWLNCDLE